MLLEADLGLKGFVAMLADVFFVLPMALFVVRQNTARGTRLAANIANERFVSGVESHVSGKMMLKLDGWICMFSGLSFKIPFGRYT